MRAIRLGGLVVWLVLAGCVTPSQYYALEREVAQLKAARARPPGPGPADKRVAELGAQVDALQDEVARLRGAIEETRYLAEQAVKEARAVRDRQGETAVPPLEPPVAPAAPTGEARAYDQAFSVYRSGDYAGAIDRFKTFLQTYSSSDHADNALFWTGECYFKLEDYERAVLTFEDVVKRYPEGNKVPDALFRQGIALLEIGKQAQDEATYRVAARQIFERLVREHPRSERVREARRQLEILKQ